MVPYSSYALRFQTRRLTSRLQLQIADEQTAGRAFQILSRYAIAAETMSSATSIPDPPDSLDRVLPGKFLAPPPNA
jgi:hypothetical protein